MNKYILPLFFAMAGNASGQTGALLYGSGGNLANPTAACPGNNPAFPGNESKAFNCWTAKPYSGTSLFTGGIAGYFRQSEHSFGLATDFGGTSLFMRQKAEIFGSLKITDNLETGIGMGWQQIQQAGGYPNAGGLTAKLGCYAKPIKNITMAYVLSNPWVVEENKNLAARSDLSVGLNLDQATTVSVQLAAVTGQPAIAGLAMEYKADRILFCASLQTGEQPLSAGIALIEKHLKIQFAGQFHRYLGFTPAISFLWY